MKFKYENNLKCPLSFVIKNAVLKLEIKGFKMLKICQHYNNMQ